MTVLNRLKLTVLSYPTHRLPQDKLCTPHAVLCMVRVTILSVRLHLLINVTGIIHFFSFTKEK
jgi:hypothetical protein